MAEDAIERNLQIIGEAVNHLPAEVTDVNPEIAWPQIRALRDQNASIQPVEVA